MSSKPSPAEESLLRLADYFRTRLTRQGLVARRLLGIPETGDDALRDEVLLRWKGEVRPDGSVGGAVLPTIWRLHEMLDLDASDHPEFGGILNWVRGLQGQPGSFTDGCSPVRHRHHACEHYLAGFFAPAPPTVGVIPVTFPTGKTFRAEPAARFAMSCLALAGVLRAGGRGPAVDQHLGSLELLAPEWGAWDLYWGPDLAGSTLRALAVSPAHAATAELLARILVEHQQPDGSWRNGETFHLLDGLAELNGPDARRAMARAVPGLLARQRSDGSLGGTSAEERSLIAVRVLLKVRGA